MPTLAIQWEDHHILMLAKSYNRSYQADLHFCVMFQLMFRRVYRCHNVYAKARRIHSVYENPAITF